jgi:hypothetical protein
MKSSSNIIHSTQASLKNNSPQTQDNFSGHRNIFETSTKSKQKNIPQNTIGSFTHTDLIDLRVKADEDRPE